MANIYLKEKNDQPLNTSQTGMKEIKFRPSTDTGDYNIKLKDGKALFLTEIRLKYASDLEEENTK